MVLIKFVVYGLILGGIYCYMVSTNNGNRMTVGEFCLPLRYVMGIVLIIELAWVTSRAFNEEMKWQTLQAVALLPVSIPSLAYRKVAGCLPGLIPSAAYTLLAVVLSIGTEGGPRGEDWFPAHFVFFAQAVFIVHLTVYLSLVLKRGAIAAALAIWFVGFLMLTGLINVLDLSLGSENEDMIVCGGAIPLVIAAVLHWQIGRRLAKVAARE